ncbi:MAG: serine/threonine protein kinase [Myxococcales bacterium]|nr:serine/threonine protein kinase [Myxococcales bacterium]
MENYGRYRLLKKLAVGGMAEVFLATSRSAEAPRSKHIVIKRLLPNLAADLHFVTMFLNEARIAARLSHPNIVQLFDLGREASSYFLAMEFIHGVDLGALLGQLRTRDRRLPIPIALWIARELCHGLHYAHALADESGRPLRVIHRDISPQNVMVSFEGEVKLLDFGIARAAGQVSTTRAGEIKGKYAYLSPEQARGATLDQRSDLFSLGLVLYEMLCGHSPFKRDHELMTLRAAIDCDIEPPSRFAVLPAALEAVVLRALQRDPDRRFASAHALAQALAEVAPMPTPDIARHMLAQLVHKLADARIGIDASLQGREGLLPDAEGRLDSHGDGLLAAFDEGEFHALERPASLPPTVSSDEEETTLNQGRISLDSSHLRSAPRDESIEEETIVEDTIIEASSKPKPKHKPTPHSPLLSAASADDGTAEQDSDDGADSEPTATDVRNHQRPMASPFPSDDPADSEPTATDVRNHQRPMASRFPSDDPADAKPTATDLQQPLHTLPLQFPKPIRKSGPAGEFRRISKSPQQLAPRASELRVSLADRLEQPTARLDAAERPGPTLPEARFPTELRQVLQRLSALADTLNALRVRANMSWSVVALCALIVFLLFALFVALLAG